MAESWRQKTELEDQSSCRGWARIHERLAHIKANWSLLGWQAWKSDSLGVFGTPEGQYSHRRKTGPSREVNGFILGCLLQAQKESGGSAAAFRTPPGQPRAAALPARLSGGEAQSRLSPLWHFLAVPLLHTEKPFRALSGVFCIS